MSGEFLKDNIKMIYCIHLQKDVDRYDKMIYNLKSTQIPYTIIEGIDGNTNQHHRRGRGKNPNGMIGCYISHEKAISTAIENNIFPCLIVEDDLNFCKPNPNVNYNIKLPDKITSLACREFKIGDKMNYWKNLESNGDGLIKLGLYENTKIWTWDASCIYYPNQKEAVKLLNFIKSQKSIYHVDGIIFNKYSMIEEVYAFHPQIYINEPNISNLTNKARDSVKFLK